MGTHPNAAALWERAERALAGGPATLSKHVSRYPAGITPAFLMDGDGARVWDVDGHEYIDCVAALGPIILGHSHPAVLEAVRQQAGRIQSSTMSTALEVEVAELLTSLIPGAEQCRFACNGADATNAALKIARRVTGKAHAIFCGYHGGNDSYLSTTDKNGGILQSIKNYNHQIAWRDFAALEKESSFHAYNLACIMLEVPPEAPGVAPADTAATIRRYANMAHQYGALFILDEIVTGFRYGIGGAQQYYGVEADMCTFSKAMANGLPISALTGPCELMRAFDGGKVFLSTTFGANPISLAACKATIETLMYDDHTAWKNLALYGGILYVHLLEALQGLPAMVRGNFARMVIDWRGIEGIATADELRTLWLQELIKRNILAGVPWFSMCCWNHDIVSQLHAAIYATAAVIREVVEGQKPIHEALECPTITDVFQQRYAR